MHLPHDMKHRKSKVFTVIFVLLFSALAASGQDGLTAQPRSEKLLNDLKVLIWSDSETDTVTVKLRIHNGAAFDPKGKEGSFALLGNILFPEESVREYFRDDLGGDLRVDVTFDYVEVTGTARADEFLTVMETLAPALINTEIDKEGTEKVKNLQIALIEGLLSDGNYEVGQAAAKRLYGDFPYGRAVEGNEESLKSIDFADLIYVRERFLTADNATLTISGNVRSDYAYLAARRLMGGWKKSGEPIPSTFRLPEVPDPKTYTVYENGESAAFASAAVEGFARKDPLFHAAQILARVLETRVDALSRSHEGVSAKIAHEGYRLRGVMCIVTSDPSPSAVVPGNEPAVPARKTLQSLLAQKVSQDEFDQAKSDYLAEFRRNGPAGLALDLESFSLGDAAGEVARAAGVSLADVHTAAEKMASRTAVEVMLVRRPPVSPVEPVDPKDPQRR